MNREQASHTTVGDSVTYKNKTYQVSAKYYGPRNADGHQKKYWPRFDLNNQNLGSLKGISYMFIDSEVTRKKRKIMLPGGVSVTPLGSVTVTTTGGGSSGSGGSCHSATVPLVDLRTVMPAKLDGLAKEYVVVQLDKAITELQELKKKYQ
jgi:hypothetical protein